MDAIQKLRKQSVDSKLLNEIENEIDELNYTVEALEKKCSLLDYWREMAHKYGKILDILKECPFVLDSIDKNVDNKEYSDRYNFGTITDEQLNIIKDWLFK